MENDHKVYWCELSPNEYANTHGWVSENREGCNPVVMDKVQLDTLLNKNWKWWHDCVTVEPVVTKGD